MKRWAMGILVIMLLLSLIGCSTSAVPAEKQLDQKTEEAKTKGPATREDQSKKTEESDGHVENLIIGTGAENNIFNSQVQSDAFGRMNYNGLTQGNFVYVDENNDLQPYFFRSFEISEDGTKLVFTFPKDAVWHDGKPVSKEDISFTFEYMRDVKKVGSLKNLVSCEFTGENEATLTFSEPDAYYWLNSSTANTAHVYPKHIWEGVEDYREYTGEDGAIGCGPFKLVSRDKDSQTSVYEAVPENNYAGEISIDRVTLQSYSGEDTLMMAMINGEIDAMFNYANPIDASIMETVFGNPDIDPGESEYSGHYQITYGMERTPCEDIQFRKAVRSALDYEMLTTVISGGYGTAPGGGVIAPTTKGFDPSIPILKTDVEEANRLLDEGGYLDADGDGFRDYPNGERLDVMVTPQFSKSSQELLNRIADTIMASLGRVGIKSHIDEESLRNSEVWEQNVIDGKYDISIGYTTSGVARYTSAFRYFVALPRFEGEQTWLWGTYHDEDFTKTFYDTSLATNDDDYINGMKKLQQMANEECFAQALCWEKAFFPYRIDRYTGWKNYPAWGVINSRTWFDLRNISPQ